MEGHPVLDHFLAALDIGVSHFTVCDIRDGWSAHFDACMMASLQYCMAARGALVMHKGERIPLRLHSFVLLPPGVSSRLESMNALPSNRVDRARVGDWPLRETVPTVKVGEGGEGIVTACGELNFDSGTGADPFGTLRRPLTARFDEPAGLRIQFVMLLAESVRPRPGSRVLMEALLKQCLVMVLRQIDAGGAGLTWTTGLTDRRLARALEAIFERSASPFSVERLADIAGMSRSAFAARFASAFGQTPMATLKAVRLRKAGELSIAKVARTVGFSSRSNFSQAFQRAHGTDPSAYIWVP